MSRLFVESVDECPPIEGIIEGRVPSWIKGTLFRNGPGLYEFGKYKMNHMFDGMAAVQRWTFRDGKITYQRKFVNSQAFQRNQSSNRIVFTEFGTHKVPDPCLNIFQRFISFFTSDENTDNTCVTVWPQGDRVFVSTETVKIHEINPETLETLQTVNLSDFLTINTATAHTHWDNDGTVHHFGFWFKGKDPKYTLFKIPPKAEVKDAYSNIDIVGSVPSRWKLHPSYVHSFGITEDFYVFVEQPLVFDILKFVSMNVAKRGIEKKFDMTLFYMLNRKTGKRHNPSVKYSGDPMFMFHIINSYQEEDFLVFDVCAFKDNTIIKTLYLKNFTEEKIAETMKNLPGASVRRYVFPLNIDKNTPLNENLITLLGCTATAVKISATKVYCSWQEIDTQGHGFELPQINYTHYNGKKYRYAYGVGKDLSKQLVKLDMDTQEVKLWSAEGYFVSEPVFLATPGATKEDDGVVLSAISPQDKDKQAFLLLLNAQTFEERARVTFDTDRFSRDLHGFFKTEMQ
ncbi:LOW QUALITY PROTEIN: beta,beta-carotene 15,15'-dioxygenase-like [Saccostrea echinata]|uniref:LOW QUALITY PROTEIN: beta,beta-carotene 15,15'-dioxygenase-like n=1 Tax=Saccostrea echinata TaxID=191078 RepID=UPI002A81579D|nr:LOW QUALITY PROTEIN: beta,beta-carotene 15,15'-dioxygenase-like [Saccostrea echinata]